MKNLQRPESKRNIQSLPICCKECEWRPSPTAPFFCISLSLPFWNDQFLVAWGHLSQEINQSLTKWFSVVVPTLDFLLVFLDFTFDLFVFWTGLTVRHRVTPLFHQLLDQLCSTCIWIQTHFLIFLSPDVTWIPLGQLAAIKKHYQVNIRIICVQHNQLLKEMSFGGGDWHTGQPWAQQQSGGPGHRVGQLACWKHIPAAFFFQAKELGFCLLPSCPHLMPGERFPLQSRLINCLKFWGSRKPKEKQR